MDNKNLNNTYCVYKHTNKINGKVYIGQTKFGDNPWLRWGYNAEGYDKTSHFGKAIAKYSWENFEHELLHENLTVEEANYWEKEEIKKYNSIDPKFGYNKTQGGSNGARNKEVGQKISSALNNYYKDNPVPKERNIRRGESISKYYDTHPEAREARRIKAREVALTSVRHYDPNHINGNKGKPKPEGFGKNRPEYGSKISEKLKEYYKNNHRTKEQIESQRNKLLGTKHSEEQNIKLSNSMKGKNKGKHYYNNGIITVLRYKCPEGFIEGKIKKTTMGNNKKDNINSEF